MLQPRPPVRLPTVRFPTVRFPTVRFPTAPVLAGALTLCLAACAGSGADGMSEAEHLQLYCQTQACVCVSDGGIFDTKPDRAPDWVEGNPTCPAGFNLEAVGK